MPDLSEWERRSPDGVTWESSDAQGVAVTYVTCPFDHATPTLAVFWEFLLHDLRDYEVHSIIVKEQQDCLDFAISTSPSIDGVRRYHFEIPEIIEVVDDSSLVDKYWAVVRKSIAESGLFADKQVAVSGFSFSNKNTVDLL